MPIAHCLLYRGHLPHSISYIAIELFLNQGSGFSCRQTCRCRKPEIN